MILHCKLKFSGLQLSEFRKKRGKGCDFLNYTASTLSDKKLKSVKNFKVILKAVFAFLRCVPSNALLSLVNKINGFVRNSFVNFVILDTAKYFFTNFFKECFCQITEKVKRNRLVPHYNTHYILRTK